MLCPHVMEGQCYILNFEVIILDIFGLNTLFWNISHHHVGLHIALQF